MSAADHQMYIQTKINPVLEALVTQTLLERPEDPVPFMVDWLCKQASKDGELPEVKKLKGEVEELKNRIRVLEGGGNLGKSEVEDEEDEDDDEDEDEVGDLPEFTQVNRGRGPRASVSAEAYGAWNKKDTEFKAPVYEKTEDQVTRIKGVLANSFLFSALEAKDLETVILAMQEKTLKAKERPICQGDDGDVLYVVEKGILDCYKKFDGESDEKLVKTCEVGDVFGELALLYNCPRAASVEARDDAVVWSLDRESFNAIVKDAASKKRELYDKFLTSVPLLESMDAYERNKIADALKTETFSDGDFICKQGDPGDKFFLLEDGEAVATKAFVEGQEPKEVMKYKTGDYFGELALLKNEPRAANVIAKGSCRCAFLDRKSFKRLLGPLEDILRRATDRYN
uniref:cAMP-dependent protein kinase regulatory subunit n=1 Tax=Chromera velia CCMP2878 TaxID=1169474 RepID=A0A0G4HIE2_9ALVE|mmetsp:Transcript_20353/g.40746  ORF Transcript_20353/g.40746 Transcript_20353/m.40746 type:complete len:399 (+) Transcript_20353:141-1337(+)|eukprot:Cvel_27909.t1-p1 / transcript=Cvel_27909.t1 / gene=Cvel_27909 / organism=Chromera_velia_CCMP2878 / gene_product=cAMP-dependent protein kinase regulatory subunit, putative / transcript_product=cAMP-dependent protein kinase regulatory subunit, putative / location=Cvel_scaffold3555:12231-15814(+) / protein_length=398 / sequence_SO=supercontig / SO=protein_coding / is_pseudo=false